MQLDVRAPMGWLFLSLGIILLAYGFIADPVICAGGIFSLFGIAMVALARRAKRAAGPSSSAPQD